MTATKAKGSSNSYTVGVDLGGTKVAAAVVSASGKAIAESAHPTVPPWLSDLDLRTNAVPTREEVKKHISYVTEAMANAVQESMTLAAEKLGKKPRITGVGLASAGPMNIEKGTLNEPSNFKSWIKVPLVSNLQKALAKRGLKTKIHFQNDAIAAALGEGWVGAARGKSTYAMITVGTGIGTGVIFNGKPAQSQGMGSEWGHMICDFRNFGQASTVGHEVEGIASGTGLIRRAKALGLSFETASELATAARTGDTQAKQLFADGSAALASLFFSLSLGYHPEVFAISGGMIAIQDLFLPQAIALYENAISRHPSFKTKIVISKLGTKAGLIGAARLPHLKI